MSGARSLLALAALVITPPAMAQEEMVGPAAAQCRGAMGYAEDFGGRRTFLWRPQWLMGIKQAAQADPAVMADIVRAGEAALARGPYSVTDKPTVVPGATANDYTSIGPYWWPDPGKADGLPYVRRDGEVNPARDGAEFDRARLRDFAADMRALSVAHYVTGERQYADHAALLVRTWFLDPATRMNPNLDFAQAIPGRTSGRGIGIIDSIDLSPVVEAIGLIRPSGALSADELAGLRSWFGEFVVWLATSKNGEEEMQAENNHGVFYDFFLAHFALFAGVESAAVNIVDAFPDYRLRPQMDRQGRFIRELERTRSWHYSHFVVGGAARLATIGECVDRDLWTAALEDGRSLRTAKAFLDRYAGSPESWPFRDIDLAASKLDTMRARSREIEILFDRGSASAVLASELP